MKREVSTIIDTEFQPGMVVVYLLRENQFPLHPEKEWRAKIKQIDRLTNTLKVEVLNEGYEKYEEWIYIEQLVRIEQAMG